jgi:hypothetical protein
MTTEDPDVGDPDKVYFASLAEKCGPIRKWMEKRFGAISCPNNFRTLSVVIYGVTVRAMIEEKGTHWWMGYSGSTKPCGYTMHDGWEYKVPPAVLLAAEYVKLKGGSGL